MKKNKSVILSLSIFLVILGISTLFHYPIHIEDALANSPIHDYDVSISFWRIAFEPVIGLLLFFNRSLYALSELPITLVWILIIFIIYTIIKMVRIKEKKFIISQMINTPIVIGLWFTIFVIILFIPLPNNTIVNNSPNSILVTTHSHTEYSHDGLISQKGLWDWHKRNGIDAFFITDHNNHAKTLDFVKAQRNNEFPIEPFVMCGEEFSGSNHLSLLGLKRKFNTRGYSDSTVIDSVRSNNGAVIVNHWFDGENKSLEFYKNLGVDGFEIENSATDRTYNREIYKKINDFCQSNDLILNGGLDFHGYGNVCSIWNAFEIPNWHSLNPDSKEEAILNIIRTQNQKKLKVLIYKDRPYYDQEYLILSPIFTSFNYFRTLNFYQLLSWIFWISLLTLINIQISGNEISKKRISLNNLIPIVGSLSGLFMLGLAYTYYLNIENVIGYSEMFEEYSEILFYTGSALFLYSTIIVYFRINKSQ